VLHTVLVSDQTCSIPGRSIFSNVTLICDVLDYIDIMNKLAILLSLDQEKAFDRVNRSFLLYLLQHLRFDPNFCRWISTFYNGAFMQIILNDFLTGKISLCQGVRLGEPLSTFCKTLLVWFLFLIKLTGFSYQVKTANVLLSPFMLTIQRQF